MTRRRVTRWASALAVAAVTLTSCATFSADAARVGDHTLSGEQFQTLIGDIAAVPGFSSFLVGDQAMDADFTRNLLNRWITGKVLLDDLTARGIVVTDETRRGVEDELAEANGPLWQQAPQALRDLFGESLAVLRTYSAAAAPDRDTLSQVYEAGIAPSGAACTRHILVDTEAEALEVLAQLRAGADFAALAAQRSTDTGSAVIGGIIEPAPGAACFDSASFVQGLVPEYVQAALTATVGEPTEPVQSQFGWHIILVRPFDEVADAVARLSGGGNVEAAANALLAAADVSVASKYGRFDPAAGSVVPPGR